MASTTRSAIRTLVFAAAILIAILPLSGLAQTAPAADPAVKQSGLMRVLAVTSGAIIGMTSTAMISSAVISRAALASLGLGGLAVVGTVAGGLVGYWVVESE